MKGDGDFRWYYSFDEEEWTEASSREAAIDAALDTAPIGAFYISRAEAAKLYDDIFDAELVIDSFTEQNGFNCPEDPKIYPEKALAELSDALAYAFREWRLKYGPTRGYALINMTDKEIYETD